MNLREHLFYQELLNDQCSLADAVRTFEKVVSDEDPTALGRLHKQALDQSGDTNDDRYYGALLISSVFSDGSDERVRDLINLVHKEALARRISVLLHSENVNLDEVVLQLAEFSALPLGESQVSTNIAIGIRVQLISSFITDNLFYVGVAKFHITMRDMDALIRRFIGKYGQRSRIGGKSAGTILANTILRPAFGEPTGFESQIGEVESYYITAQAFNRFIQQNRLEEGHSIKYLDTEEREAAYHELEERFLRGAFSDETADQLREMLRKLGDGPLIVRSSSLLEDSMGYQFHGKYESVFISNEGTPDERLEGLLQAIRSVYVSILSNSVIEYRKDKALLDYDDMMSILVQKVVGKRYGKYFFPAVAGVAFSRNQYCWSKRINPTDGVARIVHGLGTRAVDRGGEDYPRLAALGNPTLRPEGTLNEMLKYSQRYLDVLNLETGQIDSVHFVDLYNYIRKEGFGDYTPSHAISLLSEDGRLETPALYPDSMEAGRAAITFDGMLKGSDFATLLRGVLALLEDRYGTPVDVEFACQDGLLYILQCRPQAEWANGSSKVTMPAPTANQNRLFDTGRDIFRSAALEDIRYIVYVDGTLYNRLVQHADKLEVARTVGRVNRALKGKRFIIMGPGRWGSVNINLGVKVGYSDINHALMLVEIALEQGGYRPEVSYGTHFFQDLIEADIIPLALYPGDTGSLDLDFLAQAANSIETTIGPDHMPANAIAETVKVIDLDAAGSGRLSVYLDADGARGCGVLG